ncbi:MAG: neutral zinc metallopeptidase [Nakamurella sp.]
MVRTRRSGLTAPPHPASSAAGRLLLLLVALLVAGCSMSIAGSPTTPAASDGTNTSAAGTVSTSTSGAAVVQQPDVVSVSAAGDVSGILADLQTFWQQSIGAEFTPLRSGYALIDTSATTVPAGAMCVTAMDSLRGNAYYCPGNDGIVIDAAALVPVLLHSYGVGGLTASIAHEFGHAIQARIGPTAGQHSGDPQRYPQILLEAQADCSAGAFLQWVDSGKSTHVKLPTTSMLSAISPLLDFRDPTDGSRTDDLAHGLGLDRLRFVLAGVRGGPAACHAMTVADLRLTLGRSGMHPQSTPRFASDSAVAAAAVTSVSVFARTPAIDVAPAPVDLAAASPYGQFAQAASTAFALGGQLYPSASGAACFTGAWTASVFGTAPTSALGSWPGDADEAMDFIRHRGSATFAELAAFADGFDKGRPACS